MFFYFSCAVLEFWKKIQYNTVVPEIKDFTDDAESSNSYGFLIGTKQNVIINV